MEKWGLGYDALAAINPRLIMIRVSGFGQTGPYSSRPAIGSIGEAMGGMRYVIGDPSKPPSRSGISIGDTLAATFACLGGMMALHARERTGRGQVVDSAIYEAVLAMMESLVTEYDKTGYIRERTGAILPQHRPVQRLSHQGRHLRDHRRQPGQRVQAAGRGHGPAGAGRPTRATRPTPRAARTRPSSTS